MAWPQDHLPVLKKHRQHIVDNIDLVYSELWDSLVLREVVSDTQADRIQELHASETEQASAILTLLEKRPTYAFIQFLKSLQETGHKDMANFLAGQMGFVMGDDEDTRNFPKGPVIVTEDGAQPLREVEPIAIAAGVKDISIGNIKPCTREFYEHLKHKSYDIIGLVKGRVLMVIVSRTFEGFEADKNKMHGLFEDLGFHVEIILNPNYLELESGLVDFATSEQNKTAKSVFVVMIAHGGIKTRRSTRPFLHLADNSTFYFKDQLDEIFSSHNAPHLISKPKVFIIQACMGEAIDAGTVVTAMGSPIQQTVEFEDDNAQATRDLTFGPTMVDCFYAFAAVPVEYTAVRDTIGGSLFINEINLVFREEAHDAHLADMLITVRKRVADATGRISAERMAEEALKEKLTGEKTKGTLELSTITTHNVHMLSKRLYFFPGI